MAGALGAMMALGAWHAGGQASASNAEELNRKFQEAVSAQESGNFAQAEKILRSMRAQNPGIFAIDESLGLALVAQEKYSEALPFLEAAVKEQADSDAAHANLGAALFRLKQNKEAQAEFEIAAKLNSSNAATQESLGRLWMETKQPAKAADAFAAAIRLDATKTELLLDEAEALKEAGQLEQAAEAAKQFPGAEQSAQAQELLGEIAEKRGAYKDAALYLQHAAELDPSEANVWTLSVEFLKHWTFDGAITELEAAVVRFPQSKRMRLGLGAAYFGDGKYTKAVPVFADLLETDQNNKLYAELLGISCTVVMQETRPRCAELLHYADSHPDDALAATYAATTIIDSQSTDAQQAAARRWLTNAIHANPKLADAHLQLAMLDQNQAMWEESIPELQAALRLKPNLAKAHYRLSLALWRTGRKAEAATEMDLQKKYHQQEQDDLDKRLRQITTFVVDVRK